MRFPVLILAIFVLFPASALAQSGGGQEVGEAEPRGASEYDALVQRGVTQGASGNLDGAVALFREAIQRDPSKAAAYVLLAAASRKRGDLASALGSFRTAAQVAERAGDHREHARALAGIADVLERQGDDRTAARNAWNAAAMFADGHRDVASPDVGRSRIAAMDRVVELDRVYAEVRRRIAEREQAAKEKERKRGRRR